MRVNPFESPREIQASTGEARQETSSAAARATAGNRYTQTILILAVPAIANLLLFNYFITGAVESQGLFYLLAMLNAIGVAFVIFGLFFGGFFVLELLTRLASRMLGTKEQLSHWYEALYDVLGQARSLAVPAAVLWAVWLWLFYGTEIPYFIYGFPMLVLAHLLAASLYVRLIWRWFKIAKQA